MDKKDDNKEITEEPVGINYGYVYEGKIYDLLEHNSNPASEIKELSEHVDRLSKMLAIELGQMKFSIDSVSSSDDGDKYMKFIFDSIKGTVDITYKECSQKYDKAESEAEATAEVNPEPEEVSDDDTETDEKFTA